MNLVSKLNEFASSMNISFTFYAYLQTTLRKFHSLAKQITFLSKSIYFAQQINLFSSTNQFTLQSDVAFKWIIYKRQRAQNP